MGKKNKKLKKKKSGFSNMPQVESTDSSVIDSEVSLTSAGSTATTVKSEVKVEDAPEFQYVRHDVKKILTLLGIIIVVLIGLYFLDLKTSYLSSIASWVYKILNIQAQ